MKQSILIVLVSLMLTDVVLADNNWEWEEIPPCYHPADSITIPLDSLYGVLASGKNLVIFHLGQSTEFSETTTLTVKTDFCQKKDSIHCEFPWTANETAKWLIRKGDDTEHLCTEFYLNFTKLLEYYEEMFSIDLPRDERGDYTDQAIYEVFYTCTKIVITIPRK